MSRAGTSKGARIFRWMACGVATLVAVLHMVHLGGDILSSPGGMDNVTVRNVVLASLLVLYCVSLLVCWKWLKISGGVSLAAIAAFVGVILWSGRPPVWSVWWVFLLTMTMLLLPSLLLLAAAWLGGAPKLPAAAE